MRQHLLDAGFQNLKHKKTEMGKKTSGSGNNSENSRNLAEIIKQHPLISLIAILVPVVAVTWTVLWTLFVSPRNFTIQTIEKKIQTLEKEKEYLKKIEEPVDWFIYG